MVEEANVCSHDRLQQMQDAMDFARDISAYRTKPDGVLRFSVAADSDQEQTVGTSLQVPSPSAL